MDERTLHCGRQWLFMGPWPMLGRLFLHFALPFGEKPLLSLFLRSEGNRIPYDDELQNGRHAEDAPTTRSMSAGRSDVRIVPSRTPECTRQGSFFTAYVCRRQRRPASSAASYGLPSANRAASSSRRRARTR